MQTYRVDCTVLSSFTPLTEYNLCQVDFPFYFVHIMYKSMSIDENI